MPAAVDDDCLRFKYCFNVLEQQKSLLARCDQGETFALQTYEEALHTDLPPDLLSIVERQYLQVKEAHARIQTLESTTRE